MIEEGGILCGSAHGATFHGARDAATDEADHRRLKEGRLVVVGSRTWREKPGFQIHSLPMTAVRSCRDAHELERIERDLGMVGGTI